MKRSLACSLSVNLNWALSAVSPATSVISTPSGTSTLNQMKSVLISTAGFSAPPPPPLPVAPPLPPQPTRATAAKRLMQSVRIAKAFFFMVVSSSICNRPWITCLYCTRGRLARVGHVSHSEGRICADKWQYARVQKRGGPMPVGPPRGWVPVALMGRMCAGARRRVRVSRYLSSMLEISTSRASETASAMSSGNSMELRSVSASFLCWSKFEMRT